MPHLTFEFLDGVDHPYTQLKALAENLRQVVAGIRALGITEKDVSCSQLETTPLTTSKQVIVKISCLLSKRGRNLSVIQVLVKKVGKTVKRLFPSLTVEVILEPLVPETHTITL